MSQGKIAVVSFRKTLDANVGFIDGLPEIFVDGKLLGATEFFALLETVGIFDLYVHGFNSTHSDVLEAYEQQYQMLKALEMNRDRMTVYVFWPGGDKRLAFPFAIHWASKTGRRLAEFLKLIPATVKKRAFGHSLGCRVLMMSTNRGVSYEHANLFGPAIDDESICNDASVEFFSGVPLVGELVIAHSQNDAVLREAYVIGTFPYFDTALGCGGPQAGYQLFPNTKVVDCTKRGLNHGRYRDLPELYSMIKDFEDNPRTQPMNYIL